MFGLSFAANSGHAGSSARRPKVNRSGTANKPISILPAQGIGMYGIRHGEGPHNVEKLIVSSRENIVKPEWGLTERGVKQIEASAKNTLESGVLKRGDDVVIHVSPATRTTKTGERAGDVWKAEGVNVLEVLVDDRLRERYFGSLELQTANYDLVWTHDKVNRFHEEYGVETVDATARRMMDHLLDISLRGDRSVKHFSVSHGDALQIGATAMAGIPIEMHRDFRLEHDGWQTAEILPFAINMPMELRGKPNKEIIDAMLSNTLPSRQ